MPELPEVETTRRGLDTAIAGRRLRTVIVRNPAMRWPVAIPNDVRGQRIGRIGRRAKYLLMPLESGALIVHLGMSGHLSVVSVATAPARHDHVDFVLDDGRTVRLTDPRRFGSVHWQPYPVEDHWLLEGLGPEPLSVEFNARYLGGRARGRRLAIKTLLMDSRVVVGVGNIYANEALFLARIRPRIAAGRLSVPRLGVLVDAVKATLASAIQSGGTTLRDFAATDGRPGYFAHELAVYGRGGEPCVRCETTLKEVRLSGRATVYCPRCQP
ncbi:MAG: bifunctional DNA-formamidopyrimidine glycosylase/DNA-(apurinic or apyrimidinic site) lyase [Gammaproteobacteria bacterium]|nr:bifunctional DNA-formamidopyrimidine glycosylase/DNA-(apurinic or apyrimidinic site) lyase [Gammaproteobacteria bacterium]MYF27488.1 bifunctional DNA-formamidopyrimidine glycosylase/DNA-(apurinic or apyrimidinic site) lyase [Gammaproteobacteria bacterium]MYK46453.1 bifunctional DNA-formamidopyrimidine glycosylase/DNA-(apurinic or apyrimidinic site) lyase [Gammaproteobacteria bacterium]